MDSLHRAALLWAIGEQPAEDLPDLAVDLLVQGMDSPALRQLAGAPRDDLWQVRALFEQALHELGIDLPSDEQAALWALARHTAQEIVDRRQPPAEGARWISLHISNRIAGRDGFESEGAAEAFVEVGRRLVDRLQEELGDSWCVEYDPEAIRPPGLRLR